MRRVVAAHSYEAGTGNRTQPAQPNCQWLLPLKKGRNIKRYAF